MTAMTRGRPRSSRMRVPEEGVRGLWDDGDFCVVLAYLVQCPFKQHKNLTLNRNTPMR